MSKDILKKHFYSLYGVISLGLIIGIAYGFTVSIFNILTHDYINYQLYKLKEDPYELSNQFNSDREDVAQVRDMLIAKFADYRDLKSSEIKNIKLGEDDIKKLKALGYLQ